MISMGVEFSDIIIIIRAFRHITISCWEIFNGLIFILFQDNPSLYLALIDIAYTATTFKESSVVEAIDYALESRHLNDKEKLRFSQRKLDFLEDFGHSIQELVFSSFFSFLFFIMSWNFPLIACSPVLIIQPCEVNVLSNNLKSIWKEVFHFIGFRST